MAIESSLGDAIAAARNDAGMLGVDLAAKAGLTPSQLSKIEHGRRRCSPEELRRIADVLELPAGQILGDQGTALLEEDAARSYRALADASLQVAEYERALAGIPRWIRALCRALP